eukprot:SAG22_NODE_861_length_6818_cov_3.155850_4_plen_106_part_00
MHALSNGPVMMPCILQVGLTVLAVVTLLGMAYLHLTMPGQPLGEGGGGQWWQQLQAMAVGPADGGGAASPLPRDSAARDSADAPPRPAEGAFGGGQLESPRVYSS